MASFPLGPRWAGLDIVRDGVGKSAAEARQLTRAGGVQRILYQYPI
jgi:hypothetical protein